MERIQDIGLKIKASGEAFLAEWGLMILVFLLAIVSFGLGRLSALEEAKPPVSVGNAAVEVQARPMTVGGLVVASRSGSVYYFPWCAGALKIAPQNERWFDTEAAAQRAGYAPAKTCKGLAPQ